MALALLTGTRTIRGLGLGFGFWLCLPVPPSSSCWWGRWEGSWMGTVARRSTRSHLVPIHFQNTAGRRSTPVKVRHRGCLAGRLACAWAKIVAAPSLRSFFPTHKMGRAFCRGLSVRRMTHPPRVICDTQPAISFLRTALAYLPALPRQEARADFLERRGVRRISSTLETR